LIVACPCALLLSATFTHGATIRAMSRHGLYIRSAQVISDMAKVDFLVMDKTGTMTHPKQGIVYYGNELTMEQQRAIFSLAHESNHPWSRAIAEWYHLQELEPITHFAESIGSGTEAVIGGVQYRIGSADWCGLDSIGNGHTYISANGDVLGYFDRAVVLRPSLAQVWRKLLSRFQIIVMSGDSARDREALLSICGLDSTMYFHSSPMDKQHRVEMLQEDGHVVGMVGDGLNDSAALQQSDVGIAISDDLNNFSPASDAILDGHQFVHLPAFFELARWSRRIIWLSFLLSLMYNVVGLSFAVQGELSPVVAAILMPISSISIIVFTTVFVRIVSARLFRS